MEGHEILLSLFLVSAVLLGSLFYYVYRSSVSNANGSEGMQDAKKKRFFFATILLVVILIFLTATLPKSPYFLFADQTPAKVVHVAAKQYNFIMSNQAIDPKNPVGEQDIEVPQGQVVEFRVTSLDVNHGFAIYNEEAKLVTQVQAMPGYVNKLRWEFDKPGKYNILCLEYCGSAHSFMRASFTVK